MLCALFNSLGPFSYYSYILLLYYFSIYYCLYKILLLLLLYEAYGFPGGGIYTVYPNFYHSFDNFN